MVKKVKKQTTYDMQEDVPVQEAAAAQTGVDTEDTGHSRQAAPAVQQHNIKVKARKRGQKTATQQRRKQAKLDKALGIADKKSTKAVKLSNVKQRKQHAKQLWSKSE